MKVGRNDPCPCGSGKKFKKGHGAEHAVESPPSRRVEPVAQSLVDLGWKALDSLQSLVMLMELDGRDQRQRFIQVCAAHYAYLLYGVTKAAIVLFAADCGLETLALKRMQYEYYLKGIYYERFPDDAVLFVASFPLLHFRFDKRWREFNDRGFADTEWAETTKDRAQALHDYPKLEVTYEERCTKKIKKKDWEPPKPLEMLRALIAPELSGTPKQISKLIEQRHFMNVTFLSQMIHGTIFALGPTLGQPGPKHFKPYNSHLKDANGFLDGFVGFVIEYAARMARLNKLDDKEVTRPLRVALEEQERKLGIVPDYPTSP